ncbi:Ankyrin repeat-containing domain [Pseudocohnilembus persalinus]|uniref:Ankyrin repeat-containing domain n=1 Tax=Pseudocohnilembus persalinus TaxID=266149 RepID=A0A0V0QJ99_PSEPJ|nr:Ankyrin repeat-containing domain [Pseudocohnilembus persalinus]|eukprot:KRX02279.1 Ankyrin repeat-containing domain [Pseudocohnilembus persalinus]
MNMNLVSHNLESQETDKQQVANNNNKLQLLKMIQNKNEKEPITCIQMDDLSNILKCIKKREEQYVQLLEVFKRYKSKGEYDVYVNQNDVKNYIKIVDDEWERVLNEKIILIKYQNFKTDEIKNIRFPKDQSESFFREQMDKNSEIKRSTNQYYEQFQTKLNEKKFIKRIKNENLKFQFPKDQSESFFREQMDKNSEIKRSTNQYYEQFQTKLNEKKFIKRIKNENLKFQENLKDQFKKRQGHSYSQHVGQTANYSTSNFQVQEKKNPNNLDMQNQENQRPFNQSQQQEASAYKKRLQSAISQIEDIFLKKNDPIVELKTFEETGFIAIVKNGPNQKNIVNQIKQFQELSIMEFKEKILLNNLEQQIIIMQINSRQMLLNVNIEQGDQILILGEIKTKKSLPAECMTYTFQKDKPQIIDYYSCSDCNINWICPGCMEQCHQGHKTSIYLKQHQATWACCYCASKTKNYIKPTQHTQINEEILKETQNKQQLQQNIKEEKPINRNKSYKPYKKNKDTLQNLLGTEWELQDGLVTQSTTLAFAKQKLDTQVSTDIKNDSMNIVSQQKNQNDFGKSITQPNELSPILQEQKNNSFLTIKKGQSEADNRNEIKLQRNENNKDSNLQQSQQQEYNKLQSIIQQLSFKYVKTLEDRKSKQTIILKNYNEQKKDKKIYKESYMEKYYDKEQDQDKQIHQDKKSMVQLSEQTNMKNSSFQANDKLQKNNENGQIQFDKVQESQNQLSVQNQEMMKNNKNYLASQGLIDKNEKTEFERKIQKEFNLYLKGFKPYKNLKQNSGNLRQEIQNELRQQFDNTQEQTIQEKEQKENREIKVQNKLEKKRLNKIEELKKNSKSYWSQYEKHNEIKIQDKVMAINERLYVSYKFATINKEYRQQSFSFAFQMYEGNFDWICLGVGYLSQIQKLCYYIKDGEFRNVIQSNDHGLFMINNIEGIQSGSTLPFVQRKVPNNEKIVPFVLFRNYACKVQYIEDVNYISYFQPQMVDKKNTQNNNEQDKNDIKEQIEDLIIQKGININNFNTINEQEKIKRGETLFLNDLNKEILKEREENLSFLSDSDQSIQQQEEENMTNDKDQQQMILNQAKNLNIKNIKQEEKIQSQKELNNQKKNQKVDIESNINQSQNKISTYLSENIQNSGQLQNSKDSNKISSFQLQKEKSEKINENNLFHCQYLKKENNYEYNSQGQFIAKNSKTYSRINPAKQQKLNNCIFHLLYFFYKLFDLNLTIQQVFKENIFSRKPYKRPASKEFFQAVANGDKLQIQGMLMKDPYLIYDLNFAEETGLHVAVKRGHFEIVEFFVQNHCAIDHRDLNGRNALYYAARKGDSQIFRYLLMNKAVPWSGGERGNFDKFIQERIKKRDSDVDIDILFLRTAKLTHVNLMLVPYKKRNEVWNKRYYNFQMISNEAKHRNQE